MARGWALLSSLCVVSCLAGSCIATKPFPGAEAEEGTHPIGDHGEAGEELEEEQRPWVSAAAAWPCGLPLPTATYGCRSSSVVIPLPPGCRLNGSRARYEGSDVQDSCHSVEDHQLGKAKRRS